MLRGRLIQIITEYTTRNCWVCKVPVLTVLTVVQAPHLRQRLNSPREQAGVYRTRIDRISRTESGTHGNTQQSDQRQQLQKARGLHTWVPQLLQCWPGSVCAIGPVPRPPLPRALRNVVAAVFAMAAVRALAALT